MSGEKLPPAVRNFISHNLSSIEQLEILRLLFTRPGEEWTAEAVYKVVLTTLPSIEQGLAKFTAAGFIEKTGSTPAVYRLRAAGETRTVIADLCKFYAEMPARVIEAIYQKDRSSVQGFADAFKLKRPP